MLKFFQHQFYLANAAEYPGKKPFFYDLKRSLLQRHGYHDGWDLQEIVYECWNCGGTGEDKYGDYCNKCEDGVYAIRQFYLERWVLGSRVYHVPILEKPNTKPWNKVEGRIKHEAIARDVGRNALWILMARYQPVLLAKLYRGLWRSVLSYRMNRLHQDFIFCQGWIRYAIAVASIFSGWIPMSIRVYGVQIVRKTEHPASVAHLVWLRDAWHRC